MARVKSIFLFCICLFTIHNSSSETANNPLQYFLADLKSLKVKFVQTLINENGDELEWGHLHGYQAMMSLDTI